MTSEMYALREDFPFDTYVDGWLNRLKGSTQTLTNGKRIDVEEIVSFQMTKSAWGGSTTVVVLVRGTEHKR